MTAKGKLNIKWTPARSKWRVRRGGFHVEYLSTAAEVLAKYGEEATFTLESGEVLSVPGKERVYLPEHADADLLHELVECSHQELVNKTVTLFDDNLEMLESIEIQKHTEAQYKVELEEKALKIQRLQDLIQGQETEVRAALDAMRDLRKKKEELVEYSEQVNNQLTYYVAKCQRLEADLEWQRGLYTIGQTQISDAKGQKTRKELLKESMAAAMTEQLEKIARDSEKEVPLDLGFMGRVMDWISRKGKARPTLMSAAAPAAPREQDAWLDCSVNPPVLRTFNNGQWK